jgi:hypothetical protein
LLLDAVVGPGSSVVPLYVVEDAWKRGWKAVTEITFPANRRWIKHESGLPYLEGEHKYFIHPTMDEAEKSKSVWNEKYPELTVAVMGVPNRKRGQW